MFLDTLTTSAGSLLTPSSPHDFANASSHLAAREYSENAIDPLPSEQRQGLIAIFICSLLSAVCTAGLLLFITYRMIFWKRYYGTDLGHNQYIVLIYNLLLADFQQALGFMLSIKFVVENSMYASDPVCFAQGWLIQVGDPFSGIFVLAIALHTGLTVTTGKRLSHGVFVAIVVGIWALAVVLVLIPTISHGMDTYRPAGEWCWISRNWESDRLYTHYIWIFIAEFGSIVAYSALFMFLRRSMHNAKQLGQASMTSIARIRRVASYMVLYPIAYVVLSLPLAAARMADEKGHQWSMTYHGVAGTLMACSGWVDVLMYALTRRSLVLASSEPTKEEARNSTPKIQGGGGGGSGGAAGKGSLGYNKHSLTKKNPFSAIVSKTKRNDSDATESQLFSRTYNSSYDTDERYSRNVRTSGDVELGDMGTVLQETTIEIKSEPMCEVFPGYGAGLHDYK